MRATKTASEQAEKTSASPTIKKLSNQRLAKIVIAGFQKIRTCLPYIIELRQRFADLPRGGANIEGCTNWKTFCILKLHRTDRAIRYALAEEEETEASPAPIKGPSDWKKTIADVRVGDWFMCEWNGPAQLMRCLGVNENNVKVFSRWFDFSKSYNYNGKNGWGKEEIGPPRAHGLQPITPKRSVLLLSEEEARRAYPGAVEQCPVYSKLSVAAVPVGLPDEAEHKAERKKLASLDKEGNFPPVKCEIVKASQKQIRAARRWLEGFLVVFEKDAVAACEPEDVISVFTPDRREILRDVIDWLRKVSEVTK